MNNFGIIVAFHRDLWILVGDSGKLACNIQPEMKLDDVELILWYRGSQAVPVYR